MPQVITPPALGNEELEGKNWYRAEALRKIQIDLRTVYDEIDDVVARSQVGQAVDLLQLARIKLNPALKPQAKRVRVKE